MLPALRCRRAVRALLMVSAVLSGAPAVVAQPAPAPSLVTVAWLADHLHDPGLVLLHVGDKAEYEAAHLPGARHVEARMLARPRVEGTLSLEVLPDDQLETALESLGIGDASRVVVYVGNDWVSPATRVVFTLDYAGLGGQSMLLDGGQPAWVKAGHPVTAVAPQPPTPGALTLRPRPAAIATMAWLHDTARQADTRIVDARASEFYTGASDGRGSIPRPGHIAGAVNLPFTSFFGEDGKFKSRADLEAMLAAAGVSRARTTVTYCHIGQQATVPYVVARLLGYDVRLYDGSFEEWAKAPATPVTRGDTP